MPNNPTTPLPTVTLTAGDATIVAEVASTPDDQQKGLSGRLSLAEGRGMLFVYDKEGNPGIWMKDMNFPIDIVWANSDGIIVTVESEVSPATYPTSFHPTAPAAYVLELPAGYAKKHNIAKGGQIVVK
jgi:uncharacterized membrane protein (UPF0127 family)